MKTGNKRTYKSAANLKELNLNLKNVTSKNWLKSCMVIWQKFSSCQDMSQKGSQFIVQKWSGWDGMIIREVHQFYMSVMGGFEILLGINI